MSNTSQEFEEVLEKVARYGYYRDEDPWGFDNKADWIAPEEAHKVIIQDREAYAREKVVEELQALQRHTYANKESVVLDGTPGGRPGFSTESARTMLYLQNRIRELEAPITDKEKEDVQ